MGGDPQNHSVNGSPGSASLLSPAMGGDPQNPSVNGFGFSTEEILCPVRREMRLAKALQAQNQARKLIPFPSAA